MKCYKQLHFKVGRISTVILVKSYKNFLENNVEMQHSAIYLCVWNFDHWPSNIIYISNMKLVNLICACIQWVIRIQFVNIIDLFFLEICCWKLSISNPSIIRGDFIVWITYSWFDIFIIFWKKFLFLFTIWIEFSIFQRSQSIHAKKFA